VSATDDPRLASEDVIVTKSIMDPLEWGLYALSFMQVCAHGEVPPELIEQRANELIPTGSRLVWRLTTEHPFEGGPPLLPVQCADDPARLHHMLSC
jgi:hypothetical protein